MDISAGINHAIAVKKDGTVWAWGSNTYGQLGIGSTGSYYSTPVKVFSGACSIAAGGYHSYVIDQNNNLYAAGKNDKGQLGLGNTANKNTFEYVINNVSKAAGGMNHSVILTFDGEFLPVVITVCVSWGVQQRRLHIQILLQKPARQVIYGQD